MSESDTYNTLPAWEHARRTRCESRYQWKNGQTRCIKTVGHEGWHDDGTEQWKESNVTN